MTPLAETREAASLPGDRLQLAVLLFAVSATAALQSSVLAVRRFALHRFISVPRDFPWMTLIAYLPFFLALGALLLLGGSAFKSLRSPAVQLGIYAFFGLMCVGVLFPTLSGWSRVLLCAGASLQVARWARARQGTPGFTRRVGLATVALVAAQLMGAVGVWTLGERVRARLAPAAADAAPGAPNVIILILDTVRAMNMSVYGYERATTPNIAAIAREGVRFDAAFSTAPWTLPSHASAFTGRAASYLEADFKIPLERHVDVLAAAFQQRGYATGAFVANLHYASWESGLGRGFQTFVDFKRTARQILLHALVLQTEWGRGLWRAFQAGSIGALAHALVDVEATTRERLLHFDRPWAETVNAEFLSWSAAQDTRPYFAFLNYFDAHSPYDPPAPFARKYDSAGVHRKIDRYDGGIEYLDSQLRELFDELRRRGTLDNTILVITGDHGEHFGERRMWEHGRGVYAPVMRVPLIVRYPAKIPAGSRVQTPVSIAEIPATLNELLPVRAEPWPGTSLVPLWEGRHTPPRPPILLEQLPGAVSPIPAEGTARGLVRDSLYLVKRALGKHELYRLADWRHRDNLASSPAMADTLRWLIRELARFPAPTCNTRRAC